MAKKKNHEWPSCSEAELRAHLTDWVLANSAELANAIVFLNGEMGAGKSTFARILLEILAPGQLSKGSPTFPLVQEYRAQAGHPIYHIDLYRLKSESELEESGILSQIEEPGALALVEWGNQFAEAFAYWTAPQKHARAKAAWTIHILDTGVNGRRDFKVAEA